MQYLTVTISGNVDLSQDISRFVSIFSLIK
jgi:hypothetical protein